MSQETTHGDYKPSTAEEYATSDYARSPVRSPQHALGSLPLSGVGNGGTGLGRRGRVRRFTGGFLADAEREVEHVQAALRRLAHPGAESRLPLVEEMGRRLQHLLLGRPPGTWATARWSSCRPRSASGC